MFQNIYFSNKQLFYLQQVAIFEGTNNLLVVKFNISNHPLYVKSLNRVWLCDPTDCSLPGSSVHGIFQAIVLEWVAIFFSRGSSQPKAQTRVSCIVDRRFTVWATREVLKLSTVLFAPVNCVSEHLFLKQSILLFKQVVIFEGTNNLLVVKSIYPTMPHCMCSVFAHRIWTNHFFFVNICMIYTFGFPLIPDSSFTAFFVSFVFFTEPLNMLKTFRALF